MCVCVCVCVCVHYVSVHSLNVMCGETVFYWYHLDDLGVKTSVFCDGSPGFRRLLSLTRDMCED